MATIEYEGMELEEITEPQIFDPPKMCVVWDNESFYNERMVFAILPKQYSEFYVVGEDNRYAHCAPLPEKPAPRRATNRELAKWLAEGKGQADLDCTIVGCLATEFRYYKHHDKEPVSAEIRVRKWDDTEWHEPTVDYLGIEDKEHNA